MRLSFKSLFTLFVRSRDREEPQDDGEYNPLAMLGKNLKKDGEGVAESSAARKSRFDVESSTTKDRRDSAKGEISKSKYY